MQRRNCGWAPRRHCLMCVATNTLFATLLLGLQRLESTGLLPLAHQAMLEDMLEGWTLTDDVLLFRSSSRGEERLMHLAM